MKNILITLSGGRTSAFMATLINELPQYKDYNKLFLFANTGKELPETLDFINRCSTEFDIDIEWLEAWVKDGKGNRISHSEMVPKGTRIRTAQK